ncbi:TIGR01244 family phosphatase [Tianweitania sp. BSSL-BM11]|uniref:TIGR01244 family phosphatase n=1 Tax=Tianweitania aestuarii TaxID=2814886 RepID=A0ABS5RR36_9HYPH|nr:TIGR01244 family sulfur transferase [Tianweitania aestuarii]MBS9719511.1 TIGR01244 family phosphatase [Tianweitania aestuarii]
MNIKDIASDYSVSAQIQASDIAELKAAGFKSVICNRPDNEDPGQPSVEEIRSAAEAAGLEFRHVPVISGQMTAENVQEQAQAFEALPKPVFAYCRSGTRSANLYNYMQGMK